MWYKPFDIHRITGEPAAKLVMNAAGSHALAAVQNHLRGFVIVKTSGTAKQEQRNARLGKFWRTAKTAVTGIVGRLENHRCVMQHV